MKIIADKNETYVIDSRGILPLSELSSKQNIPFSGGSLLFISAALLIILFFGNDFSSTTIWFLVIAFVITFSLSLITISKSGRKLTFELIIEESNFIQNENLYFAVEFANKFLNLSKDIDGNISTINDYDSKLLHIFSNAKNSIVYFKSKNNYIVMVPRLVFILTEIGKIIQVISIDKLSLYEEYCESSYRNHIDERYFLSTSIHWKYETKNKLPDKRHSDNYKVTDAVSHFLRVSVNGINAKFLINREYWNLNLDIIRSCLTYSYSKKIELSDLRKETHNRSSNLEKTKKSFNTNELNFDLKPPKKTEDLNLNDDIKNNTLDQTVSIKTENHSCNEQPNSYCFLHEAFYSKKQIFSVIKSLNLPFDKPNFLNSVAKIGYHIAQDVQGEDIFVKLESSGLQDSILSKQDEKGFMKYDNTIKDSRYDDAIQKLLDSMKLIQISPMEFITQNYLKFLGVDQKFISKIYSSIDQEARNHTYISVKNLLESILPSEIINSDYAKEIARAFLCTLNTLNRIYISETSQIFSHYSKSKRRADFILFLMENEESVDIYDIISKAIEIYGAEYNFKSIEYDVSQLGLYFNKDTERIYRNKEIFYKEIGL